MDFIMVLITVIIIVITNKPRPNDSNRFLQKDAEKFLELVGDKEDMELNMEMARIMKRLWMDKNLQHCFRRSKDFQLNDSAE